MVIIKISNGMFNRSFEDIILRDEKDGVMFKELGGYLGYSESCYCKF